MLLLFPLIYITSFLTSVYYLIKRKEEQILLFFIFGLSIYTTALSVSFMYGLTKYIVLLQSFKEIIIICALGSLLYNFKGKMQWHLIDKLVLAFFCYSLLYIFLPLGKYDFTSKMSAFKSLSFFALIYFTGRLINPSKIYVDKYFRYISLISILAIPVLLYEVYTDTHFQTFTGFSDFNYYFFNTEPSGNYGLTWTFEISNGIKRFASFFSNPLEFSASTLLSLSIMGGLYTTNSNKLRLDNFGWIVLFSTLISVVLALSRAAFASYFLLIYVYAFITGKKKLVKAIHYLMIAGACYFVYRINSDLSQFIVDTLNFDNPSSVGHIIELIDGVQAIVRNPLGLGLGESGKISQALNSNIGGENQFVIIGVQIGLIGLVIYTAIYFLLIKESFQFFSKLTGKEKKVCLAILLMKIGFIVPMLTSNFESYIYLSYINWFFCGIFINMIAPLKELPIVNKKHG